MVSAGRPGIAADLAGTGQGVPDPQLGLIYFATGNCGPDYDGSIAVKVPLKAEPIGGA